MRKLLLLAPILGCALSYDVRFTGINNPKALNAMLDASQLVSLQHRPPPSINGLRYRINSDIPELMKVLHAYAYYDATIETTIEPLEDSNRVNIIIHPGPQFTFKSFKVSTSDCKEIAQIPGCTPIPLEEIGSIVGKPALSLEILNAEMGILRALSRCAHPLSEIINREVVVDLKDATVSANACVKEGPFTTFGKTSYFGFEGVSPQFIKRRIAWEERSPYDSDLVTATQSRLLNSELFSSVLISHSSELDEFGSLPLKLSVSEAKHKRISLSAFYATITGLGGSAAWTHRNLRGMGESLSIKLEYSQKAYQGMISYKFPDFFNLDQTYRALGKVNRVNIRAYNSLRYRVANYLDRMLPPHGYISLGLKTDHTKITHSETNGTYCLIGLPFFGKYERVENPINPKAGYTLTFSSTPYQSLYHGSVHFIKQRLTGTCYIPILPNKKAILALLIQAGSIAGTKRSNIPLSKLFLGGSENDLRGYKYSSVSPLRNNRPLGGRSAIYASTEVRLTFFENFGVVPFADFGTVSDKELPSFDEMWLKSVGLGLRYFAFFGPLRFDIGFPIDKRKGIDSNYQIYASVGQSF